MAIRRFSDPPVMGDLEGLTVDAGGPRSDPRLSRRLLRPQATHVDIVQPEAPHAPAVIVLAKEILATHCRTASLGITAVVEDPARAERYLVYVNRSQVDLLGGLFGGLKRKLIEGRVASDSAAVVRLARSRLETGTPLSVRNPTAP